MLDDSVLTNGQPFTAHDAHDVGVSSRRLQGPGFTRVFRDVYVDAGTRVDLRVRALAALRLQSGPAVASHTTAARLYGLPVPHDPDVHVQVRHQHGRRRREGIRPHHGPWPEQTTVRHGVPVTLPVETFIALGQLLGLVDLVACGDALVASGLVSLADLRASLKNRTLRGARQARRAAALVRERVDSPQESRLRMLMVLAGLPEPVVNHAVRADDGSVIWRFDLSYPDLKVVVEYDGRHHAENGRTWQRDIRRREALERDGWIVIVVTAADLFRRPADVLARIRDALGRRGVPADRLRLTRTWQRHFSGAPEA